MDIINLGTFGPELATEIKKRIERFAKYNVPSDICDRCIFQNGSSEYTVALMLAYLDGRMKIVGPPRQWMNLVRIRVTEQAHVKSEALARKLVIENPDTFGKITVYFTVVNPNVDLHAAVYNFDTPHTQGHPVMRHVVREIKKLYGTVRKFEISAWNSFHDESSGFGFFE